MIEYCILVNPDDEINWMIIINSIYCIIINK